MAGDPLSSSLLGALVGDGEVAALFSDEAELAAMLRVEEALAQAQAEIGLIGEDAAFRVVEACRTFVPDWNGLATGMSRDGVVVPELVRQLRQAVGEPHERAVHLGATSQDVVDTGLVLRLRDLAALLSGRIAALVETLRLLKRRDGDVGLVAHTRMQQALPFTAADKLDTWIQPLERHEEALREMEPRLLTLQLGGPIGNRGSFHGHGDALADALAERLGLAFAPAWHSQRDRIGAFAGWLSLVSGTLGKIGQDIALMAQNEVGQVRLASGGGSSAMPHKSNPVQAEVLVALARFNAGLLGTLHQALVHENERSGAAWTLEWLILPRMAETTGAGLAKAQALADGLRFVPSAAGKGA